MTLSILIIQIALHVTQKVMSHDLGYAPITTTKHNLDGIIGLD